MASDSTTPEGRGASLRDSGPMGSSGHEFPPGTYADWSEHLRKNHPGFPGYTPGPPPPWPDPLPGAPVRGGQGRAGETLGVDAVCFVLCLVALLVVLGVGVWMVGGGS